jgi:hypothetical protein
MADLADIEVIQAMQETAALVVAVVEVAAAELMLIGTGRLRASLVNLV